MDDEHPLVHFAGSWVQSDPVAAGAWLVEAPLGELRNRAILQYAMLGGNADPARVARLAMTLPASSERQVLVDRVFDAWKSKDEPDAAMFTKEHDFPKEGRETRRR